MLETHTFTFAAQMASYHNEVASLCRLAAVKTRCAKNFPSLEFRNDSLLLAGATLTGALRHYLRHLSP